MSPTRLPMKAELVAVVRSSPKSSMTRTRGQQAAEQHAPRDDKPGNLPARQEKHRDAERQGDEHVQRAENQGIDALEHVLSDGVVGSPEDRVEEKQESSG